MSEVTVATMPEIFAVASELYDITMIASRIGEIARTGAVGLYTTTEWTAPIGDYRIIIHRSDRGDHPLLPDLDSDSGVYLDLDHREQKIHSSVFRLDRPINVDTHRYESEVRALRGILGLLELERQEDIFPVIQTLSTKAETTCESARTSAISTIDLSGLVPHIRLTAVETYNSSSNTLIRSLTCGDKNSLLKVFFSAEGEEEIIYKHSHAATNTHPDPNTPIAAERLRHIQEVALRRVEHLEQYAIRRARELDARRVSPRAYQS